MKRIFAILLAVVMILALVACGNNNQPSQTSQQPSQQPSQPSQSSAPPAPTSGAPASYAGKTLTIVLDAEPSLVLPPVAVPNGPAGSVVHTLYNSLYELDENGKLAPSIAKSYEWVDELNIRVFLRDDVYDVKGYNITAEDVVYSWQTGAEIGMNRSFSQDWDSSGFVIENDYTLIMKLTKPNASVWDGIDNHAFMIISKQAVADLGGIEAATLKPICSTGRYKFVEWVPGQHILLEYNEDYWDKSYTPAFQFIRYTFVGDSTARTMAVQSGAADVATALSKADATSVGSIPGLTVHAVPSGSTMAMYINCGNGPTADVRVRQAIRKLIDPADVQFLFDGSIIETSVCSSRYFYWEGGKALLGDRSRDVDGAKALLAEAGYPNGFSLELVLEPNADYPVLAQLVQANLADAGIQVEILTMELPEFFSRLDTTNFGLCLRHGGEIVVFNMEWNRFDRRAEKLRAAGHTLLDNPALDQYIDAFSLDFDINNRIKAAAEIQRILIEDVPVIGFVTRSAYAATKDNLGNIYGDGHGVVWAHWIRNVK